MQESKHMKLKHEEHKRQRDEDSALAPAAKRQRAEEPLVLGWLDDKTVFHAKLTRKRDRKASKVRLLARRQRWGPKRWAGGRCCAAPEHTNNSGNRNQPGA